MRDLIILLIHLIATLARPSRDFEAARRSSLARSGMWRQTVGDS